MTQGYMRGAIRGSFRPYGLALAFYHTRSNAEHTFLKAF
jgi:hypothetical protein